MTSKLEIKTSTIEKAGVGVFAKENIKNNEVVAGYVGVEYPEKNGEFGINTWKRFVNAGLSDDQIFFLIQHQRYKVVIDHKSCMYGYNLKELIKKCGKDSIMCCGSLINHSDEPNCKLVRCDDSFLVIPLRDIKKGEELFIDYGSTYWKSHKLFDEINEKWKKKVSKGENLYEFFERQQKEKNTYWGIHKRTGKETRLILAFNRPFQT